MTHAERMAALVAAGEALSKHKYRGSAPAPHMCPDPSPELRREWNEWAQSSEERRKLERRRDEAVVQAAPTLALAAEGMKALKEWRECERQMNNVPNDTDGYQNAYSALVAAWKRLDELLAQWEEGT